MGPCAESEVTISENGCAKWLGLDFVNFIGDTEYSVSRGRARAISDRASRFDLAAFAAAADRPCTTDMRKARIVVEATRPPPCLHVQDSTHYEGEDDVEVRADAVDEPHAVHRGEVLDANIARLRANPSFRIELWTMGRPSEVQRRRPGAYAAALVEAGVARERITTEILDGSGGSKLGAIADDMVRVAITSCTCLLRDKSP